eukprot:2130734-Ditylum_brightwellii.AAC.1
MKDCIITEKLQSHKVYTEIDIPVTQQLLKMIRQCKWAGGHPIPTAATATTGLSLYAVGPMTKQEVINFNLTVDAIKEVTYTTAAEIKSTKLKATTPAVTNEWIDNIKGYINLKHSLFEPTQSNRSNSNNRSFTKCCGAHVRGGSGQLQFDSGCRQGGHIHNCSRNQVNQAESHHTSRHK